MKTADITDRQVVEACADAFGNGFEDYSSWNLLIARTGAPPKVAWRAMERADARGLIDWGTTMRCAWPEPKGLALLSEEQRKAYEFARHRRQARRGAIFSG